MGNRQCLDAADLRVLHQEERVWHQRHIPRACINLIGIDPDIAVEAGRL
jgi:hypothetical protein